MKSMIRILALAAALVATGTVAAAGFGDAAGAAQSGKPVRKGKPKPKSKMYQRLKAAKTAAEDWEQPILAVYLNKGSDDSTMFKRFVLNRKELQTFFSTNCVLMVVEQDPGRRNNNNKSDKLSDEDAFLAAARKAINGIEFPAAIVADAEGKPKAQVGKYVIDVGAGPWITQFDAALKQAGFGGAKMTKEAQKIVDDNKPDGKTRQAKR